MTTQAENLVSDELDLGTLESGTKKKYPKTVSIPEDKSTFRLLPALDKKNHFVEMWYQWFKFVEPSTDGSEPKTFWATGRAESANNPIRVKQQAVGKRKAELETPYSENVVGANGQASRKVNEDKMPKEVLLEYKKLKGAERYLKSARHVFVNASTLDGAHVVLRMPKTVFEMVTKEIKRLVTENETLNPLSLSDSTKPVTTKSGKTAPSFGVWFDFERTGTGLQTKYTVKVRKSRVKVEVNGKTLIDEQYDHTSLPESIQNGYESLAVDLTTLIPTFTNDELTAMLKGDKSPVDKKRGFTKSNSEDSAPEAVVGDATEGLSLGDDELVTDDIPQIDL